MWIRIVLYHLLHDSVNHSDNIFSGNHSSRYYGIERYMKIYGRYLVCSSNQNVFC